jgi:hypothetical protein
VASRSSELACTSSIRGNRTQLGCLFFFLTSEVSPCLQADLVRKFYLKPLQASSEAHKRPSGATLFNDKELQKWILNFAIRSRFA